MARCLFGQGTSLAKLTESLQCRSITRFSCSSKGSSLLRGFQVRFFGSSLTSAGSNFGEVTWGVRPSSLTSSFRRCEPRSFSWDNELRTRGRSSLSTWSCVFSTCGSISSRTDNGDPSQRRLHGRARDRLVQTRQKIKETGEKVKEKMEDFALRRENILTIPNLLCGARIVLSPILGYLVVQKSFECALGVFVFAGLTDLLDGFIARNFKNQQSTFGSFLDPLADKFLVFCLVLSLTCSQLLPVPLTALIIARDACLIGASAYVRYVSLPLPKTWSSYFDVTHATARLSPTLISKCNTFVQLVLVAGTLASPVFHLEHHPFLPVLWYLTATTTVASALSYIFSKNTYHILKDLKDKK